MDKTSGKTFRVVDSPDVRKIYNLRDPLAAIKNNMPSASANQLQQYPLTAMGQSKFPASLNKQLQESSLAGTSQTPSWSLNQLKQCPSSAETHVQSPAVINKQYHQSLISSPAELTSSTMKLPQTISLYEDNNKNTGFKVKTNSLKTKRRRTNGNSPRASWKHSAILRLIHYYKINKHNMDGNSKRHEEIWQDISDAIAKEGYQFSHLQCEDKWKYLKKVYTETVDKNKESGTPENTCPYFNDFHEIYGKSHSINPPALVSNRTMTDPASVSAISSDTEEECLPKEKKSRVSKQLESWIDNFRNDAAAREEARQKRHEESLGLQKEQMLLQNELLAKILNKLS